MNIPLLTEPYARRHISKDDRSHFDLADQLQDLHATILEKLDNLEVMRGHLREEYVPSNVCQNLEQCLKDSEVGSLSLSIISSYFLNEFVFTSSQLLAVFTQRHF